MKNKFTAVKSYVCLKPFLNGLSFLLGILFLGLMSCSSATDSTSSGPIKDKTPPTVTISTNENLEKDKTGTITFTFSERVKGFTKNDVKFSISDFPVNDITIGNFIINTNNPKEYSLNITPKLIGTLTITVSNNSFEDLSGNQNTDSFSTNFSVKDKTPPTVIISTNESLEIGKTGTITFTFSEKVTNFTPDEIQLLMNGVNVGKDKFVTNNQESYSLQITPKAIGTLHVIIPANSFEDLSGNQNTDSFSTNFSVEDKTPPTVIISTNESLEIGKTGTITFTFSEKVTNFTKNDVKFSSSDFPVNDITIGNFTTNNSKEYSLKITPKLSGTLTVSVQANSFYDLSGNQNTDSFSTNFWVRENIPPTVIISTNESLEIGKTGTITFTFSEKVTNFTPDEIQLLMNGVNVGKDKFVTNGLTNYFLDITPKIAGTLTVSIPANSFEDLSGNQNTDSFSTNFSVEDKTPPTVTISTNESLEIGKTGTITFTFSEKVTNFTPDEIQLLMNGVNVDKDKFVTNNQESYSLQITPKAIGTLHVIIPANSFEDLSGNQNNEAYSSNFTVFRTYTIYFKPLNGGSFISPQITTLKVVSNEAIEQTKLEEILSYPPTGPKPGINAVTRGIFEWRNNGTKYELSTPVSSDLTLEAVWSNSCGKVETVHPANRNELKTYTDAAIGANATTNLNHIDTSAITDMSYLFNGKNSFNGDIACWNISKVNNLTTMFSSANAFNGDISNWNVANITDMSSMFQNANAFNQDISNWNVSKVTDMSSMFQNATVFNKDISSWGVSNVTDMSSMFQYARAFDQDLSTWPVSNVTNHIDMFTGSAMATKTSQQPTFP